MPKNIRNNPRTELNFLKQPNTGIEPRFRRGHPEPRLLHIHIADALTRAAIEQTTHLRPRTSREIDGIADGR